MNESTSLHNITAGSCPWDVDTGNQSDNATDDPLASHVARSQYIFIVCYPVLLLICTLGNLLNITVLSSIRPPQCATVFLIALAVGDLLTLWMQLPQYMFILNPDMFTMQYYSYEKMNAYTQGWYIWMQMMWPVFSDWILIAFSVERVKALFNPLSYHGPPAARRARIVILCILLYAALSCVYKAVVHYYVLATRDLKAFSEDTPKVIIPGLPGWLQKWSDINGFYKLCEVIVIFLILLICALCVIRCIVHHRQTMPFCPSITSTDRTRASGKMSDFGCIHILLAAVATYLICNLPAVINEILGTLSSYPYCIYQYRYFDVMWRPVQLLMLIPYSFNFYLYLMFCHKFRTQARALLCMRRINTEAWLSKQGLEGICVFCPQVGKKFASLKVRDSAEAPMVILDKDRDLLSKKKTSDRIISLHQSFDDNATEVTHVKI